MPKTRLERKIRNESFACQLCSLYFVNKLSKEALDFSRTHLLLLSFPFCLLPLDLVSEFRCCFTLCLIILLFVQFGLLSGRYLGKSCPLGWLFFSHFLLSICNIYLFPVLVLREGFAF